VSIKNVLILPIRVYWLVNQQQSYPKKLAEVVVNNDQTLLTFFLQTITFRKEPCLSAIRFLITTKC